MSHAVHFASSRGGALSLQHLPLCRRGELLPLRRQAPYKGWLGCGWQGGRAVVWVRHRDRQILVVGRASLGRV